MQWLVSTPLHAPSEARWPASRAFFLRAASNTAMTPIITMTPQSQDIDLASQSPILPNKMNMLSLCMGTDDENGLNSKWGCGAVIKRAIPAGLDGEVFANAVDLVNEWERDPDPDSVDLVLKLFPLLTKNMKVIGQD